MSLRVWIKSHAADRVLRPLRKELVDLIEADANVLEVGCGTGDLLFQAAHKLSAGYGVDIDQSMIEFAKQRKNKMHFDHLSFQCIYALKMPPRQFDIATSTLCLHELPRPLACDLLRMMVESSKTVLIADYTKANSLMGKVAIEFDEMISGHYRNFKQYRRSGGIPAYAQAIGAQVRGEYESAIEGISIWRITAK